MIELIATDEYGVHYATDTFLTLDDAKDALWQMESALEDTHSEAHYWRLQGMIQQLRELIDEEEA